MQTRKIRTHALCTCVGFLLIIFSTGCKKLEQLESKIKVAQPQGTLVAKVDNLPITLEQLEQEVQNYNQLMQETPAAKITTREQKLAYLNDELVRRYLFYLEAKAEHLDERPKVREMLKGVEINILANQFFQDKVGNLTATSSEVEEFYKLYYKDQYQQAEERRIREIVVDSEQEAKDILIELLRGTDFATIASQRSKAASSANGGDLGVIKKGQRGNDFAAFDEVAFSRSLAAGQISNIFKVKDKYYILKVEAIKEGQAKPLSEVWDEINKNILFLKQQQKLQELAGNLLKKNKVIIYENKIK